MKISVVTPSYNQGWALERTIKSVLAQNYHNLEYIIIDGGSTDNSLEIIKKYEKHLKYWVSEKDSGQSNAINKGFSKATGDIYCWINSDDFFAPNALNTVEREFLENPTIDVLTGGWVSYQIVSDSYIYARPCGLGIQPNKFLMFGSGALLGQHSTFWKKSIWDLVGGLEESYHLAMDHDLFCKFLINKGKFRTVADYLAFFTLYPDQKSNDIQSYWKESFEAKKRLIKSSVIYNTPLNHMLVKLIRKIFSHKNTHPSLGLKAPDPDFNVKEWVTKLS